MVTDDAGWTAFQYAAYRGHLKVVQVLFTGPVTKELVAKIAVDRN